MPENNIEYKQHFIFIGECLVTLLEVEAFLAIIKYGNLSTASEQLFVTQPALTRRIQTLEKELGYPLFIRRKGHREVQLTEQGNEFFHIAWKWQHLLEETAAITEKPSRKTLSIASIDSLNHNMLSDLFPIFISEGYLLRLYNAFSEDTYQYMEKGIYDLAFITIQDYFQKMPKQTQMRPAYSEKFVVASAKELPNDHGIISLDVLHEPDEVFVAWNKDFKAWHANNFNEQIDPMVILEHAALASYFLSGNAWTFCPYTTGQNLAKKGMYIYTLRESPPDQVIYYLVNENKKSISIEQFLKLLNEKLKKLPPEMIHSFL